MAELSISINGRRYSVACEDGQEEHLGRLARYLDDRVGELAKTVGQVGDARLLVLAGLLIADELSEAYMALANERGEIYDGPLAKPSAAPGEESAATVAARHLEDLARRIEAIAERIERT